MKKIVVSLFFLIVGMIIFSGCSSNSKALNKNYGEKYENFEYNYSKCEGIDPRNYTNKENYIENIYWKNESLFIKSKINVNCVVNKTEGLVYLDEDKINLVINEIRGDQIIKPHNKGQFVSAMCTCDFYTEFKINDISKKSYQIIINKNLNTLDNLTILNNGTIVDMYSKINFSFN